VGPQRLRCGRCAVAALVDATNLTVLIDGVLPAIRYGGTSKEQR
jgi:hypothetical protein